MELLGSAKHGMLSIVSYLSSLNYPATGFLLKPIFLRGVSGSLHLVLLLTLLTLLTWKKLRGVDSEASKESFNKKKRVLCYKQTLFCCSGVSLFSFVWCLVSYFYWYRNGWSDDKLVTLLDLEPRTLSWDALCVYLHSQLFSSHQSKFPLLLRVWWASYFLVSCYCLVIEIVLYNRHNSTQLRHIVLDVISVISGFVLCCVGFLKYERESDLLDEPLLNGDSSTLRNLELNKLRGGDAVTPYSNAGLVSNLTFSWMGSLIAVGNKKTLDLEDVPQLDSGDSVVGAFPCLRDKLESGNGASNGITTFKLVKALIFVVWKDILWTAFMALLYTAASYVGPYLIDVFVQCLSGRGNYKNQGYILATTFFLAKLVECVSRRRWLFTLQQAGIRIRVVLVAMIYNKGLTLSCQSKQGYTSGEIINFMTLDAERIGDFCWYMHDP